MFKNYEIFIFKGINKIQRWEKQEYKLFKNNYEIVNTNMNWKFEHIK